MTFPYPHGSTKLAVIAVVAVLGLPVIVRVQSAEDGSRHATKDWCRGWGTAAAAKERARSTF